MTAVEDIFSTINENLAKRAQRLAEEEDDTVAVHAEAVAFLNKLNLMARDIDAIKHAVIISLERGDDDFEDAAIVLSALNTYKNTYSKEK